MAKSLRDTTLSFYVYSFFDDFLLIYPLYTVMFADYGLTAYEISSLLVVWSLTAFLLEVPAGSIADKYPRRYVLIAGVLLRAVGYGVWFFERTYAGFLVGFVLWGVKTALTSGTEEALVYDELKRGKNLPLYAKVTGRMQALSLLAITLASLAASILAHSGYGLILILSIGSVLVSAAAILILPPVAVAKKLGETRYLSYLKDGFRQVTGRPKVVFIVGFISIVAGLGAADNYFSLFFRQRGLTNTGIAFWIAVITLLGACGSFFAHRFEHRKLRAEALLVVWAGLLFAACIAPKFLAPFMLGLFFMFCVGAQVLFNAYLQKEITDKTRATATSVGGLTSELLALLTFGIISVAASHSSYAYGFKLIAGAVLLSAAALFLYNRERKIVV